MGKTFTEKTLAKKEAGQARKRAKEYKEVQKERQAAAAAEDVLWSEGAADTSKKAQAEAKKQEAARKKAEKEALMAEEEAVIKKESTKKTVQRKHKG